MNKKYILALDSGTTSNRAIIFDENAEIVAIAQKELKRYFSNPGWVEQDANELWTGIKTVIKDALEKSKLTLQDISAIGITNQRETTILWDKNTGKPIYNAIVWQSRQSASICDELIKQNLSDEIKHKTGLPINAYFSATKLKWILDNIKGAREKANSGELLFGTVDSWLVWKLTKGKMHATDYSNASRTMLFNIRELKWDEDILNYLQIPKTILPEVCPSSHLYGYYKSVPIAAILGDQQSALFGQQCFETGMAKNTYGTGCFLLMNIGENLYQSNNGLITTIAWNINGKVEYALEGSIFSAGSAIQWLRDNLRLIKAANETEDLAQKVKDTSDVYFVPAFTGLGAPYWDENARGTVIGISSATTKEHIIRATLESIAYQTKDILLSMNSDSKIELKSLRVDGGASMNNFLMQFQADILGIPVIRSGNIETTAWGAASLAGLNIGIWKSIKELKTMKENTIYTPQMDKNTASRLYKNWGKAVKRSLNWENELD